MKKIIFAYTVITNSSKDYEKTIFETYQSLLDSKLDFSYSIFINGVQKINPDLLNFINKDKFLSLTLISKKLTLPNICLKAVEASQYHQYIVRIDEEIQLGKISLKFAKNLKDSKKELFIPSYLIKKQQKFYGRCQKYIRQKFKIIIRISWAGLLF